MKFIGLEFRDELTLRTSIRKCGAGFDDHHEISQLGQYITNPSTRRTSQIGSLGEIFNIQTRVARQNGLTDAQITKLSSGDKRCTVSDKHHGELYTPQQLGAKAQDVFGAKVRAFTEEKLYAELQSELHVHDDFLQKSTLRDLKLMSKNEQFPCSSSGVFVIECPINKSAVDLWVTLNPSLRVLFEVDFWLPVHIKYLGLLTLDRVNFVPFGDQSAVFARMQRVDDWKFNELVHYDVPKSATACGQPFSKPHGVGVHLSLNASGEPLVAIVRPTFLPPPLSSSQLYNLSQRDEEGGKPTPSARQVIVLPPFTIDGQQGGSPVWRESGMDAAVLSPMLALMLQFSDPATRTKACAVIDAEMENPSWEFLSSQYKSGLDSLSNICEPIQTDFFQFVFELTAKETGVRVSMWHQELSNVDKTDGTNDGYIRFDFGKYDETTRQFTFDFGDMEVTLTKELKSVGCTDPHWPKFSACGQAELHILSTIGNQETARLTFELMRGIRREASIDQKTGMLLNGVREFPMCVVWLVPGSVLKLLGAFDEVHRMSQCQKMKMLEIAPYAIDFQWPWYMIIWKLREILMGYR